MSASSGRAASARATTSGPIPRGSPSVTARRGRGATGSEADVDVGEMAQLVDEMLHHQVLAETRADLVFDVIVGQLAFAVAGRRLQHHVLRLGRILPRHP